MKILSKIKSEICKYIIIMEWIENGEFRRTERIVVIGTRFEGMVVNRLFKDKKNIYYCTDLDKKYVQDYKTKWIVFDSKLKKYFPQNQFNILILPKT